MMDRPLEAENVPSTSKLIDLTKSLKLQDLISDSGATFEVNFDALPDTNEEYCYPISEVSEFSNPNCSGLVDEDTYNDGEPFEILGKKMENLSEDGLIKKRILREGYGQVIPEKAMVTIHFNAYTEYKDEPFDSTYLRKKPFVFTLNSGMTIPGIDLCTQSMKISEKSQFLVDPEYAYGPLGCLQRVPPNSTVLFEIEVLNYVDAGAAMSRPQFNNKEEHDYNEIRLHAHALCAKAREQANKGSIKAAIKNYNNAVTLVENCKLREYSEQENQQELLVRCYTNLAILYTKIDQPARACTQCNKVYYICKGTTLKVPVKVHFNHGRSLIQLGDYAMAEQKLKQAQRLEPQNIEISRELLKLEEKKKESYAREVAVAKAMFKSKDVKLNEEFKCSITDYCKELIADKNSNQYNIPDGLNENEISFCKNEAEKHGLKLRTINQNNGVAYVLIKKN
ncbi:hypothetical protein FQR65_LT10327 [Abscondita terminalis]|nr:hypothetical protein FQR65_LT10327 [Abscondita terminalis]